MPNSILPSEILDTDHWTIHKFGGTSLGSADGYQRAATIVRADPAPHKGVVVSAMSGVTDALIHLVRLAEKKDESYLNLLIELERRHLNTLFELVKKETTVEFRQGFDRDLQDIRDVLRGIYVTKTTSQETLELISGYGELWSAQILNLCLNKSSESSSTWLDAREVLTAESGETSPVILWELSQQKLNTWKATTMKEFVVITGFIASRPDGVPTTLQRNGSDFSAAIFGHLLKAESVTIWTDVDGVLSADPRRVPDAFVLKELSYSEAMELAFFGAKVLHPSTMEPAIQLKIPIFIRNSFQPHLPGTKIHDGNASTTPNGLPNPPVKGFAAVDQVSLINLEGSGMIGIPGISQRLFGALKEVGVSVILISQASSEHSICFAVPERQGPLAVRTVGKAFFFELQHNQIHRVQSVEPCTILAAVGDGMVDQPGISAKFFSALAKANVNVRAIAQGSSERNISAVIDEADSTRALQAVHSGFYLSDQTISVGLIGPGLIGKTLLSQLAQQQDLLRNRFKVDLRVRAIANSHSMWLSKNAIDLKNWKQLFEESGEALDLERFTAHVNAASLPHAVIIDCTSSEKIAEKYEIWLREKIHIITPNKKANSGQQKRYQLLQDLKRQHNVQYLYETTVCAGLPVIQTLRDLIQTGDQIQKIEGVFSGTLSYLFNSFDGRKNFSEIVREARDQGFTEPDPRDDLSGMDVARKVIILAREMGLELNLDQVAVENLVPEALRDSKINVEQFMAELPKYDNEMNEKLIQAQQQQQVLRYVGLIDPTMGTRVELKPFNLTHPFAGISGSDNILAFTSRRYLQQPLVVRGPGAGPEVTAGGIFADLLRLASHVGATL